MSGRSLSRFAALRHALVLDDLQTVREIIRDPHELSPALKYPLPFENDTLLNISAARNQPGIVEELFKVCDYRSRDDKQSALDAAMQRAASNGRPHNVALFLRLGASPHARDDMGYVALHGAAISGCVEAIELLTTAMGADFREIDSPSPLTCALLYGQQAATDALIEYGSYVDAFSALLLRDKARLKEVINSPSDTQQASLHGFRWGLAIGPRLLHVAVLVADLEMVNFLLEIGVEVDTQTENGLSALCLCAMACRTPPEKESGIAARGCLHGIGSWQDQREILRLLLDRGARKDLAALVALNDIGGFRRALDTASPSEDCMLALVLAAYFEDATLACEIIRRKGASGGPISPSPLAMSVLNRNLFITQSLLDAGVQPNEPGALLGVIARDNSRRLHLFLEAGLDPDCSTGDNRLLHECCEMGAVKCLEMLLARGASVSATDNRAYGFTPLHVAAISGHSETPAMVRMLRLAGADDQAQDRHFGATPADWITYTCYPLAPEAPFRACFA
jgi:ankyrin repeat protein